MRRLATSGLLLTFLALACNFGAGIVIARHLGADGRGALLAVQVLPLLCGWLFSFGLATSVAVDLNGGRSSINSLGPQIYLAAVMAPMAVAFSLLAVPYILAAQDEQVQRIAMAMTLTCVPAVFAELCWGVLLGSGRNVEYQVLRAAPSCTMMISYVSAYGLGVLTLEVAVAMAAVSNTLPLVALRHLTRRSLKKPTVKEFTSTVTLGAPVFSATIGQSLLNRLDLVVLPIFLSSATLGLYSIAANLTSILAAVAGVLLPFGLTMKSSSGPLGRRAPLAITFTGVLGTCGYVALVLASPWLIPAVYGSQFASSVAILQVLGLVGIFAPTATLALNIATSRGRVRDVLWSYWGAVAVFIVCLSVLVRHGPTGVATSMTTAQVVLFVSSLILVQRSGMREGAHSDGN